MISKRKSGSNAEQTRYADLDRAGSRITVIRMPTLTFKVSDDEARLLRARARAEKTTLSAFLRARVLDATPARRKIVMRKHPVSGLPYDAGAGKRAVVTRAAVKALLADFP
jgi:hypothetical protein